MGRNGPALFRQLSAVLSFVLGLSGSMLLPAHRLHSHPAGPKGEVHKHELGVAITCASPPYYYLNGDGGGSEWRLISAAFQQAGHPARALYLPLASAKKALKEGWLDAVWVCGGTEVEMPKTGHWPEPLLPRRFAAITLADADIPLQTVADLAGKTVGIHPESSAVLGDIAQQLEQMQPPAQLIGNYALLLLKLYTRRIDVLVIET